jgi:hypothetical protein
MLGMRGWQSFASISDISDTSQYKSTVQSRQFTSLSILFNGKSGVLHVRIKSHEQIFMQKRGLLPRLLGLGNGKGRNLGPVQFDLLELLILLEPFSTGKCLEK